MKLYKILDLCEWGHFILTRDPEGWITPQSQQGIDYEVYEITEEQVAFLEGLGLLCKETKHQTPGTVI